jgi:hypothetical protein
MDQTENVKINHQKIESIVSTEMIAYVGKSGCPLFSFSFFVFFGYVPLEESKSCVIHPLFLTFLLFIR